MKRLTLFVAMGLMSISSTYASVRITCPQVNATIHYGQSIQDASGKYWRVWAQANTLAVDTMKDPYYRTNDAYKADDGSWTLSCVGGWKPTGGYTQYAFIFRANYNECRLDHSNNQSFICQCEAHKLKY